MNKEIIAIKSKIDALRDAEVKADPASEVKPSVTSNEDITNLKKESEETKTNLNKLKENVQNIVKKIKEEFTANKTDTVISIEGIKKEI
jgi:hypothetical protein